ncbi:hypothetical protein CVIRNUC_005388 [Coccomyxa viridis]|uniref:Limiting CO2-inducible protein B/C beta carbonyic anhydrase domain-containing protein n=1 Tax=Coccomyxa viridis TaxID=1274662 RepID=A0AAV1I828_9CHLO|nr:hypothetical protein CVIRNUC_005388 [Coccomyxa viridis]
MQSMAESILQPRPHLCQPRLTIPYSSNVLPAKRRSLCISAQQSGTAPTKTENGVTQQQTGLQPLIGRQKVDMYAEQAYLTARTRRIAQHFPTAIGVDDFLNRLEVALFAYGFTGDNSIAMSNMCRDEITGILKTKLDIVFGSSFNTNGLGGVLTCGVTGVKAGLSHSPISAGSGKERYVFLSFPHISVDAMGTLGAISRPGRPGQSCACGALNAALADIKATGLKANCKRPGEHEPLDPEYSILKQRLARRIRHDGGTDADLANMDLVDITKIAERTILDDLEYLISQTITSPSQADYAVISGVQIHNWGQSFDNQSPNLEYIAPSTVYTVVAGERTYLDLNSIPQLTPRQIRVLSSSAASPESSQIDSNLDEVCGSAGDTTTLRSVEPPYSYSSKESRRAARKRAGIFAQLIEEENLQISNASPWPGGWQSRISAKTHKLESDNSCTAEASSNDSILGDSAAEDIFLA